MRRALASSPGSVLTPAMARAIIARNERRARRERRVAKLYRILSVLGWAALLFWGLSGKG